MLSGAAVNSLGDMVSPCRTLLLRLILLLCYVGWLSSSCWCRFPSGVRCTHLLTPVLKARSVLIEFALSRMWWRVGNYIPCTSPSIGIWRGCVLSLSICFWIKLALVAGFRRVSSLAFSLVLSWELYRCLIADISVCNSWGLFYFPSWRLPSS